MDLSIYEFLQLDLMEQNRVTNTSFQIPPDYLQDFFAVMRNQLKILKK